MPEVIMPKMGDAMAAGTLSSWLKHEGDQVEVGDVLAEIETDKATMELEAEDAGVLTRLIAGEGDEVAVGKPIAMISEDGHLSGVLTTGDLTRLAERDPHFLQRPVAEVMTQQAKTAGPDDLAGAAVGVMQRHGVIVLPVVENGGAIVGVVHLHDLMRAGAV